MGDVLLGTIGLVILVAGAQLIWLAICYLVKKFSKHRENPQSNEKKHNWLWRIIWGIRFRNKGYKRLFICGLIVIPLITAVFCDWQWDFEESLVLIIAVCIAYLFFIRVVCWIAAGFSQNDVNPDPVEFNNSETISNKPNSLPATERQLKLQKSPADRTSATITAIVTVAGIAIGFGAFIIQVQKNEAKIASYSYAQPSPPSSELARLQEAALNQLQESVEGLPFTIIEDSIDGESRVQLLTSSATFTEESARNLAASRVLEMLGDSMAADGHLLKWYEVGVLTEGLEVVGSARYTPVVGDPNSYGRFIWTQIK